MRRQLCSVLLVRPCCASPPVVRLVWPRAARFVVKSTNTWHKRKQKEEIIFKWERPTYFNTSWFCANPCLLYVSCGLFFNFIFHSFTFFFSSPFFFGYEHLLHPPPCHLTSSTPLLFLLRQSVSLPMSLRLLRTSPWAVNRPPRSQLVFVSKNSPLVLSSSFDCVCLTWLHHCSLFSEMMFSTGQLGRRHCLTIDLHLSPTFILNSRCMLRTCALVVSFTLEMHVVIEWILGN